MSARQSPPFNYLSLGPICNFKFYSFIPSSYKNAVMNDAKDIIKSIDTELNFLIT